MQSVLREVEQSYLAQKLIAQKDPQALVGSRILLSVVTNPVPECHDFSDLAWLYDIGYRRMMLCDELCLKEPLLGTAINVFDSFRNVYANDKTTGTPRKRFFGLW
jgi:hypothetical protein